MSAPTVCPSCGSDELGYIEELNRRDEPTGRELLSCLACGELLEESFEYGLEERADAAYADWKENG